MKNIIAIAILLCIWIVLIYFKDGPEVASLDMGSITIIILCIFFLSKYLDYVQKKKYEKWKKRINDDKRT
jgi:hypothetical protein